MRSRIAHYLITAALFGFLGSMNFLHSAETAVSNGPGKTRAALVQSLRTNLDYCDNWLAAKDFKSLGRTVSELPILVAAVNRHTAESDAAKIETLRKAVAGLSTATKVSDGTGAKTAIEEIKNSANALAETKPAEQPKQIEKAPGGFGPLMSLIDGTFADAKTAASVGDAAEAKQSALALADLSLWLAADRNDERWKKQSNDLVTAANDAATSDATDAKSLRKIFHDVYDRCEACHAVRRTNKK